MKIFGYDENKKWDYENGYHITSHITRFSKFIAHYELYKKIINLPGEVVECGVFKGASLIRFASFRNILESSFSRKIIGFDVFDSFPNQDNIEDSEYAKRHDKEAGHGIGAGSLKQVFKNKNIENFELIKGDINITIPEYVKKKPELKISLLHIDVDVYKPTISALKNFYDKVVPNGIIILDDYSTVHGETRAVDEFFKDKNVEIQKLPISHIPCFIIKK